MKIPFGKHRGEDIEDIPSPYLRWLAQNCDDEEIAIKADEEYNYRERYNCHIYD